jgi:hypothetical protein
VPWEGGAIVTQTVVIDSRFRGPPDSANGGYTCALVASLIDGPAQVTLKAPPPLDTVLILRGEDGAASLTGEDGTPIATGTRADVELEVPAPVSLEEATRAAARYPWRERHPYPTCFVCGPQRESGDGLDIFPGPVEGSAVFAAPWTPDVGLADEVGVVRDEFVWAALDCPSGIVTDLFGSVGRILLGRLTADLKQPVGAGSPHVVQAWTLDRDGRKLRTASALFDNDGELCASAQATWIEVADER